MKKGDIYIINLENNLGSIQAGRRPVIIVQNDIGNQFSPTTIICPITTRKKPKLPTHAQIFKSGGLRRNSIALCEQITTINKTDLERYIGTISDNRILKRLDKCLLISLGIIE